MEPTFTFRRFPSRELPHQIVQYIPSRSHQHTSFQLFTLRQLAVFSFFSLQRLVAIACRPPPAAVGETAFCPTTQPHDYSDILSRTVVPWPAFGVDCFAPPSLSLEQQFKSILRFALSNLHCLYPGFASSTEGQVALLPRWLS